MSDSLFQVLNTLEKHGVYYTLDRTRPDSVRVTATFVGERTEIDVTDEGRIEVSRLTGDEDVETGFDVLLRVIAERTDPADRA